MTISPKNQALAYFVTPHGYGHAARAVAVMAALRQVIPNIQLEIFTTVSAHFFADSLGPDFGYHHQMTDIGLVQKNSLQEDVPETVRRLDEFLPFAPALVEQLAQQVLALGCQVVLCDIAPLGLAVAKAARLPSILVENFTWDWIYEGYSSIDAGMARHIPYLRQVFASAETHIQTQPICAPQPVELVVGPISRKARTPAAQMREQLGLPSAAKVIMVTMGGSSWDFTFLRQLIRQSDYYFIIATNDSTLEQRDNLLLLPRHSTFFHPDLVNVSDAVIGKVGYSTLAEIYQAGVPYGYIPRPRFRESAVLSRFIADEMQGLAISPAQFQDGSWLARLPELLALPRLSQPDLTNGADQIARFVQERLSRL